MATDLFSGLAAPALFLAAGAGLQALLPRPLERSLTARVGLSMLLGAAWCATTVWTAGSVLDVAVSGAAFVAAAVTAVVGGVAAIAWRGGDLGGWRIERGPVARRGRLLGWALAASVAAVSAALVADAMLHPVTDFDGRMTWGTLARYILDERTVLPAVVRDAEAYVVHPRYPLVMPLLQVAAADLGGAGIESRAVRPLYALLFPALLAAIWPLAVRAGGRRGAALALAAVFAVPAVLWDQEIGPLGTYSDLALAAMLAVAAVVLTHPRARSEGWRGPLAGLALAAAAGIKNEGLLMAPWVAGMALAWAPRGAARRTALKALVPLLLFVALVLAWRAQIPNRNDEEYFGRASAGALVDGLRERGADIAGSIARESLNVERWGALFVVLPLMTMAGARGLRVRVVRFSLAWLAGGAGLALAAYATAPRLDILDSTWERMVLQVSVPLALVLAASVRAALRSARGSALRHRSGR